MKKQNSSSVPSVKRSLLCFTLIELLVVIAIIAITTRSSISVNRNKLRFKCGMRDVKWLAMTVVFFMAGFSFLIFFRNFDFPLFSYSAHSPVLMFHVRNLLSFQFHISYFIFYSAPGCSFHRFGPTV